MNLQPLARRATSAINPTILCTIRMSAGSTLDATFTPQPAYQDFHRVPCQVQPLTSSDLRHLDGLNLQATMRGIYVTGNSEGVNRAALKGGDLFIMPNLPSFPGPTVWLATQVLEHWDGKSGWTKVAVTLQVPQTEQAT